MDAVAAWLIGQYDAGKYLALAGIFILALYGTWPILVSESAEKSERRDAFYRKLAWSFIAVYAIIIVGLSLNYNNTFFSSEFTPTTREWALFVIVYLFGKVVGALIWRYIIPVISNWWYRIRISQTGDQPSDIRTEANKHKPLEYDPQKYYREGDIFRGLNEKGKPVYDSLAFWKNNHQSSVGPTQTGKGVEIGMQIDQAIRKGMCVVYVDPKPDKFVRPIMMQACEQTGRAFVEIDLTGQWDTPGYAFTKNGTLREIRDRLIRVAGLEETGTDADFYKLGERKQLDKMLQQGGEKIRSFDWINDYIARYLADADNPTKLESALGEIHRLESIRDDGLDTEKLIEQGSVLYVRAATQDTAVRKTATAMIENIIQAATVTSEKNRNTRKTHLFLVIDEIRFLVNNYIADVLASIKDTDTHLLIAYQSILDIRNTPDRNIDGKALEQSINVNTSSKLVYGASDYETAEWAAEQSGTIQKKVADREKVKTNRYGGEQNEGERMITFKDGFLVEPNEIMMFPPKTALLLRQATLGTIIKTHWIDVDIDRYRPKIRTAHDRHWEKAMQHLKKQPGDGETLNELLAAKKAKLEKQL